MKNTKKELEMMKQIRNVFISDDLSEMLRKNDIKAIHAILFGKWKSEKNK